MRPIEEILACRTLDVEQMSADGGRGKITVSGMRCSVVFSWGGGWEHVSISPFNHRMTPTWDDMCRLKRIFFEDDEAVIQIHPRKQDYVNVMKNCLHLWRPTDQELPLPPLIYV